MRYVSRASVRFTSSSAILLATDAQRELRQVT